MPPAADIHGPSLGISAYLDACRELVIEEIRGILPSPNGAGGRLYELMLDYPLRGGKALRPALCIAASRALGGHLEAVASTAAVLELYHNAFLVHDDVEDGSEKRRGEPTLHRLHGVPIAVNVGDGMLALTLPPLLDNMRLVGLGRALRILECVARMARESAEGQMIELDWVRAADWTPCDRDYVRMVYKKTCWYTFLAPVLIGAIAAGADDGALTALARFATPLGVAFQIQDDALNLIGEEDRYGKEILGDLWEGKHTLMLIHAMRAASPSERGEAQRILKKPRPPERGPARRFTERVEALARAGRIDPETRTELLGACEDGECKTAADVAFLRDLIARRGGVAHARRAAHAHARRAARSFGALERRLPASAHRDFLAELVAFVVAREC